MKKILVLFVIGFTLIFGTTILADTAVKVQNPGFEQVKGGKIQFWAQHAWHLTSTEVKYSYDDKVSHSGKRSAVINNIKTNDARYKQVIKVDEDSLYKISCWVKTQNVGTKEKGACIAVESILDTSNAITGTSDWKEVVLYGKTIKGQTDFTVTVGIGSYGTTNTGKAWFDDVKIVKIDKTPSGVSPVTLSQTGGNTNNNTTTSGGSVNYVYVIAIIGVIAIIVAVSFFINRSNKKEKMENPNENENPEEDVQEEAGNEEEPVEPETTETSGEKDDENK